MASWASVAKATAQPSVAPTDLTASTEGLRLLVVDANAIISGVRLEGIADRAITIQEVYDEIRDKRSRQFLSTLPYQLQISEPTEESIKIVTRFARETGDVSTLSSNDIKLLALAHTLEVAAHGSAHLATHAAQPRMHSKPITSSQPLPGWGTVSNPEDWKVVDEANDADEAAGASRIAQQVQQLTLDPAQPDSITAQDQPAQQQQQLLQQQQTGTSGSPIIRPAAATTAAVATAAAAAGSEQAANGPAEAEATADDSGWEVAASSAAAARRKKRKEHKQSERQRAFEAEWEEHARLVQEQVAQQEQQPFTAAKPAQQQNGTAAEGPEQHMEQQNGEAAADGQDDHETDSDACSEQDDEPATIEQLLAAEHQVYVEDDEADSDTAAADSADSSNSNPKQQQQQQEDGLAPGMPGWQSSIASVTADFAMQNVLLQMGLRLITRDGRRIARLSRYALRCTACFTVTREAGRLFCPKCGNMTLDRVEVVTGPDGAEYFGIKKKHILRGTRFSLPKPRGGRNSKDPVLREDIFLLKVKALGRRAGQRRKQPVDSTADPAESGDAESGQQSYVASQTELAQHRGLAAVLQPAWKNNPNERKLTRSNRRR